MAAISIAAAAAILFLAGPALAEPLFPCPEGMEFIVATKTNRVPKERQGVLWDPEEYFDQNKTWKDSRIYESEMNLTEYFQLMTGCKIWIRPYISYGTPTTNGTMFGSLGA